MKRTLITLSLALVSLFASAQEDSVRFRITYDSYMRYRQSEAEGKKDVMVLDVGERSSRFFPPIVDRRKVIYDSIVARGGNAFEVRGEYEKQKIARLGFTMNIFKNYPRRGRLVFCQTAANHFRYEENLMRPDWELLDRDTTVCGYDCQMAATDFLGRRWTVAYTTEIPLSDGPWKLWGLPGLILDARDSLGDFWFSAIGIENGDGRPIRELDFKYVKCSPEEFEEIEILRYQDVGAYEERTMGKRGRWFDANGREFKPTPDMPVLIEFRKTKKN